MKVKSYLPKQASQKVKAGAVLVDVRCEAENKFVGRPLNCILIPWLDDPEWLVDEDNFIAAFERFGIDLETEIILICRSGYRSDDAGKCLISHGFNNVAHVKTGFEGDLDEYHQRGNINGWRYDGIPWEQC